ncbi:MAG: ATPase [Chloroflexi bacterium]|nr:ATPase [Chloroflexota bacterium]
MLNNSWRTPFTSNVMINEDDYLAIIEQMKISIPDEVREAKRMVTERERILAQAQEEADRIVLMAREDAESLVHEHEIQKRAEDIAREIITRAEHEAIGIRADADDYVLDVLSQLEAQLTQFQTTVRNGISALEDRRAQYRRSEEDDLPDKQQEPSSQPQSPAQPRRSSAR